MQLVLLEIATSFPLDNVHMKCTRELEVVYSEK